MPPSLPAGNVKSTLLPLPLLLNPSSSPYTRRSPAEISSLLVAGYDRKGKGLWVAIPSLSSHTINLRLRVLPILEF